MLYKSLGVKTIFILLFLTITYTGFAQNTDFKSCGINDIDQIRKEIKFQPTTAENVVIRRAALYRWWRLLWHQGYDMDAFDEESSPTALSFGGSFAAVGTDADIYYRLDVASKAPKVNNSLLLA